MVTSEEESSEPESEHEYEHAKVRARLRAEEARIALMWKKQDRGSVLIDDPTVQFKDLLDRASTTITDKKLH